MILREAVSKAFSSQVWSAVKDHMSPPEQLRSACLEEFRKGTLGERIEVLRAALNEMNNTGIVKMDKEYEC
jgi:hypothetical protein